LAAGDSGYERFVEPGNVVTASASRKGAGPAGIAPARMPQMPNADLAIEQGADASRDLPAAEKLSTLLYDLIAGRHEPRDSDIEGRFSITKIEPDRIWL
jgi:hypothetical protein